MSDVELLASLQAKFPETKEIPKTAGQVRGDEPYVSVPADKLLEVCQYLRFDPPFSFDFLSFVTSIDFKDRFEVVYYLVSTLHKHKMVLKVNTPSYQDPVLPSVTGIWAAADWQEREIFDLMGIRFDGHYNLRRILLPDDWEGYPLRKDYVAKADRFD